MKNIIGLWCNATESLGNLIAKDFEGFTETISIKPRNTEKKKELRYRKEFLEYVKSKQKPKKLHPPKGPRLSLPAIQNGKKTLQIGYNVVPSQKLLGS